MTPLFWMIVGHFACDFPFQPDQLAQAKNPKNSLARMPWFYVMMSHCLIHGGAVALATGSTYLGIAETVIHIGIDLAKCKGWTNIHVDQALHLTCKLIWWTTL